MILLACPFNTDFAADQIVQYELAVSRHEEPYDAWPTFRFKSPRVGIRLRPPTTAIDKRPTCSLRRFALGL
jgi:hypothetical protein